MLGESDQGCFASHVIDRAAIFPAVDGRHADYPSPALLPHMGQHQRDKLNGAKQVELHPLPECLDPGLLEVGSALSAAGVVHQYVGFAQGFDSLVMEILEVLFLHDIGLHGQDFVPLGLELGDR